MRYYRFLLPLLLLWSVTASAQQSIKPRLDSMSAAVNAGRSLGSRQKVSEWAIGGGLFGLPIGFGLPYILDNQSHDPPARGAIGAAITLGVIVAAAPLFVERVTIPDSLRWIRSNKEFARGYQRGYASEIVPRRRLATVIGSAIGTAVGAGLFFTLLHAAYAGE